MPSPLLRLDHWLCAVGQPTRFAQDFQRSNSNTFPSEPFFTFPIGFLVFTRLGFFQVGGKSFQLSLGPASGPLDHFSFPVREFVKEGFRAEASFLTF